MSGWSSDSVVRPSDINSLLRVPRAGLTARGRAEKLAAGQVEVAGLQTIQQLQARALRRAEAVDELDRLLYATKGQRRAEDLRDGAAGLWAAVRRLFLPNRLAAKVEKLERQQARARAALKIAVDELHQAHCQQLRTAPWSGSLLAPTETGLRDANEDLRPWNRVQMSGKRALAALTAIGAPPNLGAGDVILLITEVVLAASDFTSEDLDERIDVAHRAGWAIRSFINALKALKQEHPESNAGPGNSDLAEIAEKLIAIRTRFGLTLAQGYVGRAARTIAALMDSVRRESATEFDGVELAQDRLEAVNHQIALAAWSKIPARLRPPGR